MRLYTTGDVQADVPIKTPDPDGYRYVVPDTGYVLVNDKRRARRQVFEHRVVMEEKIGRPLEADETVHHINGVRDDNHLENLELWVKRQPSGQRVADRVADAHALLLRYAPHLLVD